jgi:hypothetical protein
MLLLYQMLTLRTTDVFIWLLSLHGYRPLISSIRDTRFKFIAILNLALFSISNMCVKLLREFYLQQRIWDWKKWTRLEFYARVLSINIQVVILR